MNHPFFEAVHADPWGEAFLDLPSLNAKASDAIEASVRSARQSARLQPRALRSSSIVVVGPPGAGKTHLFSRLRRKLGPRAIFVHVRPLVHVEMTPRFLIGEVVRQLTYSTLGVSQANALVGSLLGHFDGGDAAFPSASLSDYEQLAAAEREARLDQALERVLEIWPEADELYLGRLLRVPFAAGATKRALFAWLSGRDCDAAQLERIGAAGSLSDDSLMAALRTLAAVASLGAPIVIVFDQLENLVEGSGQGTRLLAYANLVTELVDAVRGMVLVHMALETEWARGIEPAFNLAQRSRVLMHRETLALPSPQQKEELLRLWLERIPDLPAPFPWPFGELALETLRTQPGLTPRMLLFECRRALDETTPDADGRAVQATGTAVDLAADPQTSSAAESTADALRNHWETCLGNGRRVINEAAEQRTPVAGDRLIDGLLAAGRFLNEAKIVTSNVKPAQLALEAATGTTQIAVVHDAHHRAIGAALVKLATVAAKHPVVVLRERTHDLPPTWKDTLAKRSALLATGNARWQLVGNDDMAQLLALDELLQSARSSDVTDGRGRPVAEAAVADWIARTLDVPRWTILSDFLASHADSDEATPVDALVATPSTESQATTNNSPPVAIALSVLRRLRIASLDRLVREALRVESAATRASVIAELEAAGDSVRWFGRTIVCVRGLP